MQITNANLPVSSFTKRPIAGDWEYAGRSGRINNTTWECNKISLLLSMFTWCWHRKRIEESEMITQTWPQPSRGGQKPNNVPFKAFSPFLLPVIYHLQLIMYTVCTSDACRDGLGRRPSWRSSLEMSEIRKVVVLCVKTTPYRELPSLETQCTN